jgi:predicted Zn-dependent protease
MKKHFILYAFLGLILLQPLAGEGQSQAGGKKNSSQGNTSSGALVGNLGSSLDMLDSALVADEEPTLMDEYYMGRAVAANILSTYRPYTQNSELTRYLNRICRTIAINSPQPEIFNGYHVLILDSPEFNAFATPGGHILVTRGLVEASTSEDVLAAALAHEFAHILLKHGTGIIADMRLNNELSATASRAADIASRENAARAVLFRNSVTKLADTMMKSGYSQAQEYEADTAAITLLAASGYNPGALMELLQILQLAVQKGGLASTHPSPAQRISSANQMTGRYNVPDTRSSRTARFRNK